ncbi:MAG: class A beta-lactamase-related serine hydrolase, partial [Actinobacteria bacterium]|nr:class A beta-lactamase-related serine hydrolase [Actinomycetota bacterium]
MPVPLTIPASAWEAVNAQAEGFLTTNTAPALSYAVVHDGRITHSGGVGASTVGGGAPGATTAFRVASMTKSFTAAAVLMLRDRDLLRLDDPISDHLPQLRSLELPRRDWREPTIRDLLTMSAGWATDDPWADREESMSPLDYDALLARGFTFNFSPGTGFEYSNLGYTMLGRIITNASGVQYQQFVTDNILRPLGMVNTGFTIADIGDAKVADGHYFRDDTWQVEPVAATGEFAPLGGLFSTCADLATWLGLLSGAFATDVHQDDAMPLSRSSLREMQQGQRVIAPSVAVATAGQPVWVSAAAYGFGLLTAEDPLRGTVVGHSGGYPGYGTHMCWHPASGIGVIALANGRYGGAFRVANSMLRTVLDAAKAPSRVIHVTESTFRMRAVVDSVLQEWDDAALDVVVAANFDADIPRQHRRLDIETALAS